MRIMAAFTGHMDIPNAPATYYGNVNSPLDVTKTAVYCTVTLISDALIVSYFSAVYPAPMLTIVLRFIVYLLYGTKTTMLLLSPPWLSLQISVRSAHPLVNGLY